MKEPPINSPSVRLFVLPLVALAAAATTASAQSVVRVGSRTAPAVLTTAQRQILPVGLPADTPPIRPSDLPGYAKYGYTAWQFGPGLPNVKRADLAPAYRGAPNAARLLSFFSISDIHITDKESPAEAPYFGWSAPFHAQGLYSSSYSPIMLSTTQVLDAAIRTVNALNRQTPLDFGISLGDVANSSQYNELRWYIDVMDGKRIEPSSGAHAGAGSIDYQKPFQAAGLDRSIPWYQVIGNHDQFWMGIGNPNAKLQSAMVGSEVLNIGPNMLAANNADATGLYVGVVDGATPLGDVIKGGPTASFDTPPTVAPDANRHSVTTDDSSPAGYMREFFNSTSSPAGHGFSKTSASACYTFMPKSNLPIKVIVLDDTCKSTSPTGGPLYYGGGWIDQARYNWLTSELQKGQDAGQLMIVACHIPIAPQGDLNDLTVRPQFAMQSPYSEATMLTTLHRYPNLIMVMAGHRHINAITPQPSPDAAHPENGFWEVETSSLREFPRQFRTFDIRRNADNSISIVTTDVDPVVEAGSVAGKSLDYAVGAARVFGLIALSDTTSHAYNAELVKQLTPQMKAKIARYGTPIARQGVRVVPQ